ncbi:MAG: hypothetical protein M1517_08920, partial [Deltaproteobacteria bacterium]|nr:hypothetical protein [Deltaproteobacteria bacterium]
MRKITTVRPYITFAAIIVYTVVAGVLVIVAGLFDYKGRMYDLISRVWSNAILYTAGIKVTIEGRK